MIYAKTLLRIFSHVKYTILALIISLVVFSIAVWFPNTKLIVSIIFSGDVSFIEKAGLLMSLYGAIITNFTVFSATYTTIIALLFGIDIAIMVYYIKKMRQSSRGIRASGAVGIGGVVAGSLGIGCASCGTFILTSLLGVFGAAGLLAFLPLKGAEFGLIGVFLLVFGIYNLLKKIQTQNTNVCI